MDSINNNDNDNSLTIVQSHARSRCGPFQVPAGRTPAEKSELARKEGLRKGLERAPGRLNPVGGVNRVDRVGHVAARQQNLPRNQPISCILVRSGVACLRPFWR